MSAIYTEEVYSQIVRRLEQTIECYKEQRKADRQMFLLMLDQFPPYHGPGHNYTKQEVEAWLAKARSMFVPKNMTQEEKP
jgi:hypothetical protein